MSVVSAVADIKEPSGSGTPQAAQAKLVPDAEQGELAGDELVALAPALWQDPDVRWLTGAHKDNGIDYLVRELYEELLWWLQIPSLLRLGSDITANRAAARQMSMVVEDALLTAEAASYRIDVLLGTVPNKVDSEVTPGENAEAGGGAILQEAGIDAVPAEPKIEVEDRAEVDSETPAP